ncbi:MAG TPA: AI-2E family transporter, partial [Anaerolineales bacterium]|nr:AI-2E family transporter [Anaerolineales bacterium]
MSRTESPNGRTSLTDLSTSRVWWLLTTAVALALVLGLGALEMIRLLALPLAMLVFALTLAAALEPIVSGLERRMPRLLAIVLTYLVVLILLGGLIWAVIPSLVEQVQDLGSIIQDLSERARELIDRWGGSLPVDSFTNTVFSQLSRLGPVLLRLPLTITS